MKHRINPITKMCVACGLAVNQKTTTHCYGKPLKADIIKGIVEGRVDFVNGNWTVIADLNKQSKPKDQPKPEQKHDMKEFIEYVTSMLGDRIEFIEIGGDDQLDFSEEPEAPSSKEVTLTDGHLAFIMCTERDAYTPSEILDSREATQVYLELADLGLVYNCGQHIHLTPKGNQHLAKLLSIPVSVE
jgi:hypothetical protein